MSTQKRIYFFDLECDNLLSQVTKIHCGTFKDMATGKMYHFGPGQMEEMCRFMDRIDVLIGHNAIGYDIPVLKKVLGYTFPGKVVDTLIMSRLQNPKRLRPFHMKGKGGPHSLAAWGYKIGRGKVDHEDWSTYTPEMRHRNEEDVEILAIVYEALKEEAKELGGTWRDAWQLCFKLFSILQQQEEYGWLVDRDHIVKSISLLNHFMSRIERAVAPQLPMVCECKESKTKGVYNYVKAPFLKSGKPNQRVLEYWGDDVHLVGGPHSRVGFRKVDVNVDKEVKDFLLKLGWEPLKWNVSEKTGLQTSPKLSHDDPFEGLEGNKVGRLIARRVQAKSRRGIMNGWLERIREDGRIASVVTNLAVTGRATHTGIVNVPNADAFFGPIMRKTFTSPKGRVLIGCDAAGCQDRMLAQRANNAEFTKMLLEGRKEDGTDSHSRTMVAVNKVLDKHGIERISRGKAKGFNFGWKFGAGDEKLGAMVGAGPAVGAEIRKAIEGVFAAQMALLERLKAEWRKNAKKVKNRWGGTDYKDGWIAGLDGRPIHIESEHKLLVYMLQSDEAIMMAYAYCLLYDRLTEKGLKWGEDWAFVMWMHDEYTIECREGLADIIKPMAEQAIADAGLHFGLTTCPQKGEADVGDNWFAIH